MPLVLVKSATQDNAFPGDTVTYTVEITNNGASAETEITFTDVIPEGATYVPETFERNGTVIQDANPNYGVVLPDIPGNTAVTIKFDVKIDEQPAPTTLNNTAQVVSTTANTDVPVTVYSNEVTIKVAVVNMFKSSNKPVVSITEELTYTVIINNSGAAIINNLFFKDTLPKCMEFVAESFTLNGVLDLAADPTVGVSIGANLQGGRVVNVSFRVKITCIPCPPRFENTAKLDFDIVTNGADRVKKTIESNVALTRAALSAFKQLGREEYVKIPSQKPDVEELLNTLVDIEITNTRVIETQTITSLEGQNLTGNKLIVEGILNQKVEYIADEPEQPVHAAHFRVPFSTFIILPTSYDGETIQVEGIVEDIYTKLVDCRTVFKNITFIVIAKFFQ